MYTIEEVLANIDANTQAVMILGSLCMLCAYIQYFVGVWVGHRDKSHAIPLAANTFFFAHDTHYAANFDYWFNGLNHWYFKLGTWTILVWIVLEIVVAWQIIKHSGTKIGLGKTLPECIMSYIAIQVGMYILFLWLVAIAGDPLNIALNPVTIVVSNLFNVSMLIGRKSSRGQSLWIAGALVVQQPIYFYLLNPLIADVFTTPIWYAAGAASTVLASVYFYMLWKAPAEKIEVAA